MRERAGRDERKQKERGGKENEMNRAPALTMPAKSGCEGRLHEVGGRVSCTGGTDGGGGGSLGLTTAQTS